MHRLMKRLEIIKAAISLGDEETIALHVSKVRGMAEETEGLKAILANLDSLDYPGALTRIEDFLIINVAVSVYADPEVSALKMELQGLERRLAEMNSERDEVLHVLGDFNRQYSLRLGGIISEILKLQMMIAGAAEAKHFNDEEDVRARFEQARKQAQSDYQRFQGDYEELLADPSPRELSKEDVIRLKVSYRKASRLCHPDMVAEELKERAAKQFQALHEAYRLNDLDRVEEILADLESGGAFAAASENMHDKDRLRARIVSLREQVVALAAEIGRIRADDTWLLVEQLKGDYEAFFAEQERALRAELDRLQREFREMV